MFEEAASGPQSAEPLAADRGADDAVLAPGEPPPFEVVNEDGGAQVLLICDHASRRLPRSYAGLGLDETQLRRHIAWDIGAAEVTRRLAERLDAPAVLSGYSRLLVDCNRPLDDPTSIVMISDGVVISGNRGLREGEAARRAAAVYWPYHRAVDHARERFAGRGRVPALLSIHSFAPVLGGFERLWHIGILWDKDPRLAKPLLETLSADPALMVGDNQPYSGRRNFGYSIECHGARAGLPQVLIEVRQDLVDTHRGARRWADLLAATLEDTLSDPELYRIAHY